MSYILIIVCSAVSFAVGCWFAFSVMKFALKTVPCDRIDRLMQIILKLHLKGCSTPKVHLFACKCLALTLRKVSEHSWDDWDGEEIEREFNGPKCH